MPDIATATDIRIGNSLATEVRLGNNLVWTRTWWSPLQITGLRLWLDASDDAARTLNGTTVSQLSDKSGNGNHATQVNASLQPVYAANGINTKGCLLYNDVGHRLQLRTPLLIQENMVVASVFQRATTGIQSIDFGRNVVNGQPYGIWWGTTNFINSTLGVSTNPVIYGNSTLTGDFISLAFRNATSAEIRLNGAIYGTAKGASPVASQFEFVGFRPGASQTHSGYWAESIICSDNSTATRNKIEGYLAHKWGIALPVTHPYHLNPP